MLFFSIYDGRKNIHAADEFTNLSVASIIAAMAQAGTLYLSFRDVSRLLFITYVLLAFILMIGWRALARIIFQATGRSPGGRRRVLIIGAGQIGREFQEKINQNPELRLQISGFLDDDQNKLRQNKDILGPTTIAQEIVREKQIDDVIIALPQRSHQRINQLAQELHHLPVKLWVIPDYFRLALYKAAIEDFAGIPMLDLRAPALTDIQRLLKRAFDLFTVTIFLPITMPLMGLIALGIAIESRGRVIFSQKRVGENGRIFRMYKFRTMIDDGKADDQIIEFMDDHGQLTHKAAADPRITHLGRLLRKVSLDELPQIINVLRGDMSLVGPRPELPYLVDRYEPWQRQRFAVPQGITGWWQINGRSNKPMHLNTEDDLYYVQHYAMLLDIYILIRTIPTVITGKGAF
jgi:exopolysaccharide biosynthesis polyprenyl glycosylphosphotransferase